MESPCVKTLGIRHLGASYWVDRNGLHWPPLTSNETDDLLRAFLTPDAPQSKEALRARRDRAMTLGAITRLTETGRPGEAARLAEEFAQKYPKAASRRNWRMVTKMTEQSFETPQVMETFDGADVQ